MTYAELIDVRTHLSSFLKIMEALPVPSRPEAMRDAIELWKRTAPDSPIHFILERPSPPRKPLSEREKFARRESAAEIRDYNSSL